MKYYLTNCAVCLAATLCCAPAWAAGTLSVQNVADYRTGGYVGDYPSPPHADSNPQRAVVISWSDTNYKLVFSHEASYAPFFAFPSGAGVDYQFLEGNTGWAELFNNYGRLEANSFAQVVSQSPTSAHVQWNYYGVNKNGGSRAYLATEDFYAHSNGLVLRKQSFVSPSSETNTFGSIYYSREPIEMIGMAPVGQTWADVLQTDSATGARHALSVLDAFSPTQYDVYWTPNGQNTPRGGIGGSTVSRVGDSATWAALNSSAGVAMVVPMKEGAAFCVIGDNTGFPHQHTCLKEHTFEGDNGEGGVELWGSASWDHWPIGWLNSQCHDVTEESNQLYPNHFSPMGLDLFALSDQTVEATTFYSLIGVGGTDEEAIRGLANTWLNMGSSAIDPASIANLPSVYVPIPEPSSLVLLGVGLAFVLCATWRHKRHKGDDSVW